MKKILVYGDSNTWGDNFLTRRRIPDDKQWCNILQEKLGSDYKVFQEGLPGRIAGDFLYGTIIKNGKLTFLSTFKSIAPVDMIIIALGSNDLRPEYERKPEDIIKDLLWYKDSFLDEYDEDNNRYFNGKLPKIIYLLPVNFKAYDPKIESLIESKEKDRQTIIKYFKDNNIDNIYFNDIELFGDCIHMNYEGHKRVAEEVYKKIINTDF